MDTASTSMRGVARQLLDLSRSSSDQIHESIAACETLRRAVTRFAGADGFDALMRRALALARAEVPSLHTVTLGAEGGLEGLEQVGPDGAVALTAHLLALLVTFMGEPLTSRILREGWPNASLARGNE